MGQNKTVNVRSSVTVGASGGNSMAFINRDCRGVTIVVKNTSASGTSPTLTVKLQESVKADEWIDVPGATTAAIAGGTAGTTQFTVYPGMTVAANAGVSRPLGKVWRVAWAIGGSATPTVTFRVDAQLHA